MNITIGEQLHSLLGALLLGVGAGLWYDLLRAFRYRCIPGLATILLDLLFWLLVTVALFCWSVVAGRGLVQVNICAALMVGFLLYFHFLSHLFFPIVRRLVDWMASLLHCFFAPFRFLKKKCAVCGKKVSYFCKKLFSFLQK